MTRSMQVEARREGALRRKRADEDTAASPGPRDRLVERVVRPFMSNIISLRWRVAGKTSA